MTSRLHEEGHVTSRLHEEGHATSVGSMRKVM